MAKWVFLNNGFTEEEKATVSFKDLSFQRGYAIFDFFRLLGNEPLFLDDHLDRFFFSAEQMRLPLPLQREDIKTAISGLIQKNNLPDTGIRISLTGGNSEDGFNIAEPTLLISQHSFTPPPAQQVQQGIRLFTYPFQRQLPQVKTIDYLMAVWLQPKRVAAGADDILYYRDGFISESPRSNIFLVTADDKLVTPAEDVLAGVTRKKVLQLAQAQFTVKERKVSIEEKAGAKGAAPAKGKK